MTLIIRPETIGGDASVLAWLRTQHIEPNDTYKVCIETETMIATVFQYKRNAEGHHYYDRDFDEVARREPWTTKLSTLPPTGYVGSQDGCRVFV